MSIEQMLKTLTAAVEANTAAVDANTAALGAAPTATSAGKAAIKQAVEEDGEDALEAAEVDRKPRVTQEQMTHVIKQARDTVGKAPVVALIEKYVGKGGKLSGIKEEDYRAVFEEADALMKGGQDGASDDDEL